MARSYDFAAKPAPFGWGGSRGVSRAGFGLLDDPTGTLLTLESLGEDTTPTEEDILAQGDASKIAAIKSEYGDTGGGGGATPKKRPVVKPSGGGGGGAAVVPGGAAKAGAIAPASGAGLSTGAKIAIGVALGVVAIVVVAKVKHPVAASIRGHASRAYSSARPHVSRAYASARRKARAAWNA